MKLQACLEEDVDSFVVVVSQCACEYRPRHQQPCCLVAVGVFAESVQLADR